MIEGRPGGRSAPWHHQIHLRKELLTPRLILLQRVLEAGKGELLWHHKGSLEDYPNLPDQTENGRFLSRSLNAKHFKSSA